MVVAYKDLGFLFCCSKWLNSDFLLGKSDLQRHFRGTRFVGDPKRHFRILGGKMCWKALYKEAKSFVSL